MYIIYRATKMNLIVFSYRNPKNITINNYKVVTQEFRNKYFVFFFSGKIETEEFEICENLDNFVVKYF